MFDKLNQCILPSICETFFTHVNKTIVGSREKTKFLIPSCGKVRQLDNQRDLKECLSEKRGKVYAMNCIVWFDIVYCVIILKKIMFFGYSP